MKYFVAFHFLMSGLILGLALASWMDGRRWLVIALPSVFTLSMAIGYLVLL